MRMPKGKKPPMHKMPGGHMMPEDEMPMHKEDKKKPTKKRK